MIYFDNNATTKINPKVLSKMNQIYEQPFNASAIHNLGRKGSNLVENARNNVKNLLNGQNYEVIFTSSATEATNMVFFGSDAKDIIISPLEHLAVYNCKPQGKNIIEVKALENGLIDIADFENKLNSINDSNFLVSVMLANNETGAILPIAQIAKLTHQKGGLIHCDIVQAAGKIEVDLEKLNIDFASISAHKINGPQGVGALLYRKGLDIKPLIYGGKQEQSKRAGTINVAGIVGFGMACEISKNNIDNFAKIAKLRDLLEKKMQEIAGQDLKIFSQEIERLPNTSYSALKNCDSQTQIINFDLNQIYVSSGAACSSGTVTESRVLKAMNISKDFSQGGIRVSLGLENTKSEIEQFIKIFNDFYQRTKN